MGTKGKRLSNFLPQKQGLTSVDEHFPWRNFRLEDFVTPLAARIVEMARVLVR
jgi:hypothetical protein